MSIICEVIDIEEAPSHNMQLSPCLLDENVNWKTVQKYSLKVLGDDKIFDPQFVITGIVEFVKKSWGIPTLLFVNHA